MASGRRLKLALILLVLVASALALLTWTQVWIDARVLSATGSATQRLEVSGTNAAPALTALALAGLALAGALTIAGRLIRTILGLLEVLLGASIVIAALQALTDPAAASASAITAATGIAGSESVELGLRAATLTAWPFLALVSGVLMAIAGVLIVVTAGRWPGATSRYQAVRMQPADGSETDGGDATSRAVDSWDDLSRGGDPTA